MAATVVTNLGRSYSKTLTVSNVTSANNGGVSNLTLVSPLVSDTSKSNSITMVGGVAAPTFTFSGSGVGVGTTVQVKGVSEPGASTDASTRNYNDNNNVMMIFGTHPNASSASTVMQIVAGGTAVTPGSSSLSFPFDVDIIGISVNLIINAAFTITAGSSLSFALVKLASGVQSVIPTNSTTLPTTAILFDSTNPTNGYVKNLDLRSAPVRILSTERLGGYCTRTGTGFSATTMDANCTIFLRVVFPSFIAGIAAPT